MGTHAIFDSYIIYNMYPLSFDNRENLKNFAVSRI